MKKLLSCMGALLLGAAVSFAGDGTGSIRKITIETSGTEEFSPYVFGHNLEHTRAAVNGGLSAQMLRNRKFAGKPSRNQGVASHWYGIGEKTFFCAGPSYTEHICLEKMQRRNELQSQCIQNMYAGSTAGIGQDNIAIEKGRKYILRCVTMASAPLSLTVELGDASGRSAYAVHTLELAASDDWVESEFEIIPAASDCAASIRYTYTEQAVLTIGALSMMPEDNFHGMRRDVVENLKAIGPAILRWPGGNFAGEYRWKDGLLPADRRGPLGAATEIETQPYTDGFDYHEINTDDFVALCREVGAEPFLTINLVWSTPEESAQWVEYCNGPTDSEYGRMRAERGCPEPYNVKFWSLGNEMGYGHMEGPMQPSDYASLAEKHASAMLSGDLELKIFSSGPYPSDRWAQESASRLADKAPYVSLHSYGGPSAYSGGGFDYTTPEGTSQTYTQVVNSSDNFFRLAGKMRECLDRTGKTLHISYDEWNQWYSWYRPSCVGEGIFAAKFLHNIIASSNALDIPVCCYFQPVGEGAILITPTGSRLTANGQVFSLMKAHKGGRLCRIDGDDSRSVIATLKGRTMTVTLINDSFDEPEEFEIGVKGELQEARVLSSDDVRPYTFFEESPLPVESGRKSFKTTLPPHSVASMVIIIK